MSTPFADLLQRLSETPILQGAAAAVCTFILEDPTTIGSGLLVADGKMLFLTAFIGLTVGITLGDLGLYAIGRYLGPQAAKILSKPRWSRLIDRERMERANRWFHRNLVTAVVFSRFVPGMRLPTYIGAGIVRAPVVSFLFLALGASIVWTLLLLGLTVKIGERVLPLLGGLKWPAFFAFIGVMIVSQWIYRVRRATRARNSAPQSAKPVVSTFEFWTPVIFYIPVAIHMAWLALRHGGLTLPTSANPSIYSGGLIGESKSQILSLVPPDFSPWVARHARFARSSNGTSPRDELERAFEHLRQAELEFPFVAKPDVGQRGAGVQLIADESMLARYIEAFPPGHAIVFQALAPQPMEAGVLYYRRPHEDKGRIFSITLKTFPSVVGDGVRTLRELILSDPRARYLTEVYFRRHEGSLDRTLPEGERFQLVFAGNHAQGAVFKNGTHLVTAELEERIHRIAMSLPEFYFGRFDVKFADMDRFLKGEDFTIVEINGAGAEATHIWDAEAKLGDAYRTLFKQWALLFEIGAANKKRGHRPIGALRVLRDFMDYRRASARYPPAA